MFGYGTDRLEQDYTNNGMGDSNYEERTPNFLSTKGNITCNSPTPTPSPTFRMASSDHSTNGVNTSDEEDFSSDEESSSDSTETAKSAPGKLRPDELQILQDWSKGLEGS
ncbi:hypothetical protein BKA82DRAFT_4016996 [Pisolithus tinctorius]|nr:hypothetical protein BKA82DRAFT_4016996 [Pisolithus tinctorius]